MFASVCCINIFIIKIQQINFQNFNETFLTAFLLNYLEEIKLFLWTAAFEISCWLIMFMLVWQLWCYYFVSSKRYIGFGFSFDFYYALVVSINWTNCFHLKTSDEIIYPDKNWHKKLKKVCSSSWNFKLFVSTISHRQLCTKQIKSQIIK